MPMFDRFRGRKSYKYSRWDGSQNWDEPDGQSVLDALSDDYLKHGDLRRALERMMQQGYMDRNGMRRMGMQDLMERLRQQRQRQQQRYNMSGVMDEIAEKLERVKQLEREGIQRRLDGEQGQNGQPDGQQGAEGQPGNQGQQSPSSQQGQRGEMGQQGQSGQPGQRQQSQPGQQSQSGQQGQSGQQSQSGQPGQSGQQGQSGQSGQSGMPEGMDPDTLRRMLENIANRKLQFLDQLPNDAAGQIRQLSDYDFMDEQAREEFQELLAMLQQQVMQQYFQGMQQAIQNMTPEELARMRNMVRDLNQMLRERAEGGEPDFDSFMQKYGDYFPGVNSLDDLVEQMQRSTAAMQAVLDSMTPDQRRQLQDMMDELIGDDRLRVDLAELAMNLEMVAPSDARTRFRLSGDEPLSLAEAMRLMGTLQEMDELEHQMREARRSGELGDVDVDKMRDLVGDEEARALQELQDLIKQLEEEGLVKRNGERYELTAHGIRRIAQKALEDIFAQLDKDAFGQHRLDERGYGGERADETKAYTFGDPFHLHLERTLMNGVARAGAGTPIRLDKEDFEVYRTEHMTQSATVVMLDMSYSMLLHDLWLPAKKVAIALESLIRGQFPRDQLYIVGFSNMARVYAPEDLIELSDWDNIQGTNMVHGLRLARQLLGRSRAINRQILMVTDGGPTVMEQDGSWYFTWPYTAPAELQTLREVRRCAREGMAINVFMLSDEPDLKHFVNQMATINKGRAFYTNPDNLGEYILIDYLNNKRKHVS